MLKELCVPYVLDVLVRGWGAMVWMVAYLANAAWWTALTMATYGGCLAVSITLVVQVSFLDI